MDYKNSGSVILRRNFDCYQGHNFYNRDYDENKRNSITTFGYCQEERKWIIFKDDEYTRLW